MLRPAADLDWSIFPAIVKPINQHGSYGIDRQAVVRDRQQLRQRLEHVMEKYRVPAVVEEFIAGREFQVSVWGNRRVEVLPEVELAFGTAPGWEERIYTYEMKFDHDGPLHHNAGFVCPSMLTPPQRAKIGRVCRAAYRAHALPRLRARRSADAERSGLRGRRESQSRYQLRVAVGRLRQIW